MIYVIHRTLTIGALVASARVSISSFRLSIKVWLFEVLSVVIAKIR
jgi:hypothetical protein